MSGFGSTQEAEKKPHFALSLLTVSHMKSTGHDCVKTAGLRCHEGDDRSAEELPTFAWLHH